MMLVMMRRRRRGSRPVHGLHVLEQVMLQKDIGWSKRSFYGLSSHGDHGDEDDEEEEEGVQTCRWPACACAGDAREGI